MSSKTKQARLTLSTVAADAGVALSTASVILSENRNYLANFSPTTVSRVRESARKLNYRAKLFATSRTARSSMFFAVALNDPSCTTEKRKVWGLIGDFLAGISETAIESHVFPIIVVAKAEPTRAYLDAADKIVHGGVLGAIALSPNPVLEQLLRTSMKKGLPVVSVFPTRTSEWPSNAIDTDNVGLGRRAGRLFAAHRRKRWLIVLDDAVESHQARLRGFLQAARSAKASVEKLPCPQSTDARQASARAVPWLAKFQPDAVLALTSRAADGILLACQKLRMRAGIDVLLIGCDCAIWQTPLMPVITSLEATWRDLGGMAMRQLLELHSARKSRFPTRLTGAELISGDTCPPLD